MDSAAACGVGASTERQSPIDIHQAVYRPNSLNFSYPEQSTLTMTNNGHSLLIEGFGPDMVLNSDIPGAEGHDYQLAQFHFHWGVVSDEGSEFYLKGKQYPLEAHFVHFPRDLYDNLTAAAPKHLLVLGVFFSIGRRRTVSCKIDQ
jgi:carbonic anhydrase